MSEGFGVGIFKNYGVYRINNTIFWIKRTGANAVDGEIYRLENSTPRINQKGLGKDEKPYLLRKIKIVEQGNTFNLIEEETGMYLGSISKTFYVKQFYQQPINADPPKRDDGLDQIIDSVEYERNSKGQVQSVINPNALTYERSGKFYKTAEGRYFMIRKDKQNYKEDVIEYDPKTDKLIYGTNLKLFLDDGVRYVIDTRTNKIVFYYVEGQIDMVDKEYDSSTEDVAISADEINDYVRQLAENVEGFGDLSDEDILFLTENILNDINRDNPSKKEIQEQFNKNKGYIEKLEKDRTERKNEYARKQNAEFDNEQDVLDTIIDQLKIQFVGYFSDTNPFWDEQSRKIYDELMGKGDVFDVTNEEIKTKVLDLSNQLTQKEFENYIDLQQEEENVADDPQQLNDILTTLQYTTAQRLYVYERLYEILEEKGVYNPTDQEMVIVFNQYKEQLEQEIKNNINEKDEVIEDEYLQTSQDIVDFLMEYNASIGDLLTYEEIQEIILSYEAQGDFNVSKTELEKSFIEKVAEVNAKPDEFNRNYVYDNYEELEEDIMLYVEDYNLSETIEEELRNILLFEWENNDEVSYEYITKKVNNFLINTRTENIEENNEDQRVYFENNNKYYETFINENGLIKRRYYEKNESGVYQLTNVVHVYPSKDNPNTYTDSFGNEISKEDLDNLVKAFGYENGYNVVENNHLQVQGTGKDIIETDENGNPIVRDENGNIIDLTKHDDDKAVVPFNHQGFRETPHSTQNIYDKNSNDINDDVKGMIEASNERKKEESVFKKLQEYKEKNVGLILGEPVKNARDVLTILGEVFNTDIENSIMLFSFTKNLNKTETFNNYLNRVQSNNEYTNWKTEIENRATHLDFDTWNKEKNKSLYKSSWDYFTWGVTNSVYGLSSIGSVKFLYSYLGYGIRLMKVRSAFNNYKSSNIRLRMADTIISRSRPIPDLEGINTQLSLPQLMTSSITKFSTQKYTPEEYLSVLHSMKVQINSFVKDYELKPSDFVKEAENIENIIPREFIKKQLDNQLYKLPTFEFNNYGELLGLVNNIIAQQVENNYLIMPRTEIIKINDIIEAFGNTPENIKYETLQKFYNNYVERFINNHLLTGLVKTESDFFITNTFSVQSQQQEIYKQLDTIFTNRGIYPQENSLKSFISNLPQRIKYPRGRVKRGVKQLRTNNDLKGKASTIQDYSNIQYIMNNAQYKKKVNQLINEKIKELGMDNILNSISFTDDEFDFIKNTVKTSKLNELFIEQYYKLIQDDLNAKQQYINAENSNWIKGLNYIENAVSMVDGFLGSYLSHALKSPNLILTTALLGTGKLVFDGVKALNSYFGENTDIKQTNLIIDTIQKMSNVNQEQIYNLINENNKNTFEMINNFNEDNKQHDNINDIIETTCELEPFNDFINAMNNNFKNNFRPERQILNLDVKEDLLKDKPILNENSLFVLFTISYLKVNVIKLKNLLDNGRVIDYFKLNYNIEKKEIERIEFIKHNNQLTKIIDIVDKNSQNNLIQIIFIGLCIISFCFQFDKEYKSIKDKNVYFTNLIMSYVDTINIKNKDYDKVVEFLIKFYKGHNDYDFNDLNGIRQHIETTINELVDKFLPRKEKVSYMIGEDILSILNSKLGITMNYTFKSKNDIINYLTNQYNKNTFHMNLNFLTKYIKLITDYIISFDIKKYFETFNDKLTMNFFNDVIFQNSIFSKLRASMNNKYEIINKDVIIEGIVFYDKKTKQIKQFVENQKLQKEEKPNMEDVNYEKFINPNLRGGNIFVNKPKRPNLRGLLVRGGANFNKKEDVENIEDKMNDTEEEDEEEIILTEEEKQIDSIDKIDESIEQKNEEKPQIDSMDKMDTFGNEENVEKENIEIDEEIKELDENKDMILNKEELKENKQVVKRIKVFSNEAKELNLMDMKNKYKFNYNDLFFRGTDVNSKDEMVKNIDMELVDFEYGGKVHKGIYSEFKKIIEDGEIEKQIKKLIEDDKPLNLIGHSKGSVLSIYTASYYKNKFPKLKIGKITLFGTPNIFGDEQFKKNIENIKFINIANSDDPISYFNVKGFYEIKKHIILEKKEKLYKILINQPNPRSYNISDIAKLTQETLKGIMNNFENHKLLTYQKLMNNLIN